ncbi:WD40/YVTN/BNR-like repeat-containing protein [Modestobacter excelsi]|uniref:WD40/YVTN/BNR-like repeat-containing protein n=1 Tax=Modestobacter excelsi TaxID=2213161 RepID=UPI00110CE500|nr:hypothetical protein [Modestobacter excelsi]
MNIPDEDLARTKNLSVEQVQVLRQTRGTTTDTLAGLSDAAVQRAIRRSEYPDMPRERALFRLEQEGDDDGRVPANALAAAVATRALMVATSTSRTAAGVPTGPAVAPGGGPTAGLESAVWEWIGPGNIGGRTRGIVVDPADPDRMWTASAGGGVWQTTDGGGSWAPVDDFLANLACASIAMDPSRPTHIYVGTGEGFNNADALRGAGIFRTTDATTWSRLPSTATPDFHEVNRIAVSPSGTVVLAATGTGIFRSADAARATWTKVHDVATGDVRFDPQDDDRAVAGAVDAAEAWFTQDGGLTWTAAGHGPWSGRVELAYAAADPTIVYASVQATNGEIWRSEDRGQSYAPRKTVDVDGHPAPYLGDQGWYDNVIWAGDPTSSDLVVVGGINLWRSLDGGDHLAEISTWWAAPASAHADQHAFVAHPAYDGVTNTTVVVGNDGGVYLGDLAAVGTEAAPPYTSGWTELVNDYGATQFYGGAGNTSSGKIIGGAQDNGTLCYDPSGGTESWTTIFGGDGGWCAADPTDPMVFYGEYVFLNIHRNTDGGTTDDTSGDRYISGQFFNQATQAWDWKPVPFQIPDARLGKALFIAPFVLDPNEPERLLAGGLQLWRTDEAKRANTPTSGPRWASVKPSTGSPISAIAVAPSDSDSVWVGHRNGMVFRTANGTSPTPTWQRVGATGPNALTPQRYCTSITVDPGDPDTVYVAFGGYLSDNVWITRNGGADWFPPASVLPPAPVRAVAVHPGQPQLVYLGTEVGLFASDDAGGHWSPTNEGPANVSVDDLIWMDETLVAVTHGRGMFRIDLSGV